MIPGGAEHEAFFPEDTEVIDFFAPVREDFLTGEIPPYILRSAERDTGARCPTSDILP